MAKEWSKLSVQWRNRMGHLEERNFKYSFDGPVTVKAMLDWTLKQGSIEALARSNECSHMEFGGPEFMDPDCNDFVDIDLGTELVNKGIYRAQLHFKTQMRNEIASTKIYPDFRSSISCLHYHGESPMEGSIITSNEFDVIARMDGTSPIPSMGQGTIVEQRSFDGVGNTNITRNNYSSTDAMQQELEILNNFGQIKLQETCRKESNKLGMGLPRMDLENQSQMLLLPQLKIQDSEKVIRHVLDTHTRAQLGQFYDMHSDAFIVGNELNDQMASNNVANGVNFKWKEVQSSKSKFGGTDYFELLGVNVQQKARVMAELCPLNGYAEILKESELNDLNGKKQTISFIEMVSTKMITLENEFDENLFAKIPSNATHLLTSIGYGAAIVFEFTIGNQELGVEDFKKVLKQKVQSNSLPRNIRELNQAIQVEVFADPMFGLQRKCSFLDALRLINELPNMIKKVDTTSALGHPLFYGFTPLELIVREEHLLPSNQFSSLADLNVINHIAKIRELFSTNQSALEGLVQRANEFSYALSEEMHQNVNYILDELAMRKHNALNACQQTLKSAGTSTSLNGSKPTEESMYPFNSSESMIFDLNSQQKQSVDNEWAQQLAEQLEESKKYFDDLNADALLQSVIERCKQAESLRALGIPFVGRGNADLHDLLATGTGRSEQINCQFVFFQNSSQQFEDQQQQQLALQNAERFNCLISMGERCIYFDTDLAQRPDYVPEGNRIVKYWKGAMLKGDYLEDSVRKLNTCIVRFSTSQQKDSQTVTEQINSSSEAEATQFELEIPCPKAKIYGGDCSNSDCHWECDECAQLIVFKKPKNDQSEVVDFYCGCGRSNVGNANFRCKDIDKHGDQFAAYMGKALSEQLRYIGEKNLLILGETGVGKSTWINAFANFITYDTLDDAIQSKNPLCLIPISFPIYDEKLVEKTIVVGPQDSNERLESGKSQTKMPKAHVFDYKTGRLRKIDTPGMADTEGLKQDEINFKYTLRYISTLKELNGIAILMDANRPKVNDAFKYCMGQLLTHLHKDAAKNIVFVFTKCGQRKDPGQALSSLRAYLKDLKDNNGVEVKTDPDNVYIMENDAFKFMHEEKHGVVHKEGEFEQMETSWTQSKSESNRLLQYILNLEPHKPMDTFSLNQARTYIFALAQPLARISQQIQTDITVLQDKKDFLMDLDENKLDLEGAKEAMKIPQTYYEIERLNYPRTVCTAAQHTEVIVNIHGQQEVLYKTICHSQCGVRDIPPETACCEGLRGCSAMGGHETCRECGCNYRDHMHIKYLQHLRTKLLDDPKIVEVTTRLERTDDKKAAIEQMIVTLERRVEDQRAEQNIISQYSAQLATFLIRNSIMAYNDAFEDYANICIREEKRIAAVTNDDRKLKGLEECISTYREHKRIILENQNKARDSDKPLKMDEFDVQTIYGELFNLPIYGKEIKKMFDTGLDSQKEMNKFSERSYPRPNKHKASANNRNRYQAYDVIGRNVSGSGTYSLHSQPQQHRGHYWPSTSSTATNSQRYSTAAGHFVGPSQATASNYRSSTFTGNNRYDEHRGNTINRRNDGKTSNGGANNGIISYIPIVRRFF